MKLIGNNDDKKYEIGNFSEELNNMVSKIVLKPERKNDLDEKLGYTGNGKPIFLLKTFSDYCVHVPSQEKYDLLMQVYNSSSWCLNTQTESIDTNLYEITQEKTHIQIKNFFHFSSSIVKNSKIWSFEEFLEKQGINENILKEITDWYEKNKPNRMSKGENK